TTNIFVMVLTPCSGAIPAGTKTTRRLTNARWNVECLTQSDRRPRSLFHLPDLARLRTYPQHTRAWLPLLRSRPGGVHRRCVVRSPKSDNLSKIRTNFTACLKAEIEG